MPHFPRSFSRIAVLCFAAATAAHAFPSWIGVYGTHARHDGMNPGRFTVMMNEDYYGLEANVGIRINGGDWAESAMNYQTNIDGNSVWTFSPAEPFPFGADVDFYFHGYEGENNLYDSANGSNYFSGPLFWDEPSDTGLVSSYPGNTYSKARICALGSDLVGAHSVGILNLARKPVGCAWEALDYPLEDSGISDFAIAGNVRALAVACITNSSSNLSVRCSTDAGETFLESEPLSTAAAGAIFSGLSLAAGAPGEFTVAYGICTNCCGPQQIYVRSSTNNGASWSAPVFVTDAGGYGNYFSWFELGRNDDGWFLAGRSVVSGSSHVMSCARSPDGSSWTTNSLGSSRAWGNGDLCLSSNVAAIVADPYYDDYIRVWRFQSGAWTTQDVDRVLESGRSTWMSHDGAGNWFIFRQVDNTSGSLWSWYLSRDNAYTWSTNRALANPVPADPTNDVFTLEQALNVGPKQYLLWHANYYIGTYQRMHEAHLQKSDGYEELLDDLQWDGSTFTVVITNATPGATNHLECTPSLQTPVWSNVVTWTGASPGTNWSGTASTQGWFRLRIEH